MAKVTLADVLDMSIAERILFVEDIWDSIAAMPEAVPITEEQRHELSRRLEAHQREPDAGIPWDEVKKRIRRQA